MRLFDRFLRQIASKYDPDDVYRINNKRFTGPIDLMFEKNKVVYNGFYLGQNKKWFQPSSPFLQSLAKEENTRKAYINRDAAWLFVVGKDVFEENVDKFTENVALGDYCLVVFDGNCLGYGRYETSGNRKVVKNMFDLGDFLRRE